jgi:RNA polymerase sigma-70 factor (ECF subfamily)
MKNHELHRLLTQIKTGDINAFRQLYEGLYKAVCSVSYATLHDFYLAEDAAQETFLTIFKKCNQYRDKRNAASWIFTIAHHTSLNMVGKTSREDVGLQETVTALDSFEDMVCDRMMLKTLFSNLDQNERQIVVMHLIAGLKHRETAAILNMPLGTVLRKYRESLQKLNLQAGSVK